MIRRRIVIVGAGISGLSAAYRLSLTAPERDGSPGFVVLEASGRVGGKIRTDLCGRLALEAGPDSFLTSPKPHALDLIRQVGLDARLLATHPADTDVFVYARGRLRRLPEGLLLMAPSRLGPFLLSDVLSWPGKLRMGLDIVLPRGGGGEESMASFARRRFGSEAVDTIVQPVMAGIYGGDAEALSLQSTFPRFLELERRYGSVIRGLRAARRRSEPPPEAATPFMTLAGGLEALPERLADRLGPGAIRLDDPVVAISRDRPEDRYTVRLGSGESVECEGILLTAIAWQAATMLDGLDGELSAALREIPVASTATVSLAYDEEDAGSLPRGFGFVVTRADVRTVTAATFSSSKFPGRFPSGTTLVRCFLGGAGHEEILGRDDARLLAGVREDLRRILGLDAKPVLERLYRWPRANPQYTVGHVGRLERIETCLRRHPGLELAGASYRGLGIPDCIASGMEAADRLAPAGFFGGRSLV